MKSSIMVEHHNIRSTQQFHPTLRILIRFLIIISIFFPSTMIPSVNAEVSLDGSLGSSGALVGPDYTIGHDLGRLHGTNLFHSFSRFNVMTGESATFTGPNAVANIIGRVTGGASSSIDGLLRSTIQDANLFLINPSGVMFGPNAALDVNGSFHVSTADYLNLTDGGVFYSDPARNSVLTVAPPSAFGFLGSSPAAITIDGSTLQVSDGETFSAVGGDIEIANSALSAPGGCISLAGVSSEGEVIFDSQNQKQNLNVDTFKFLGEIDISQSGKLSVSGNRSGIISIRGNSLSLDRSKILSHGWTDAGDIDIQLSGDFILTNKSELDSSTYWSGSGGEILIEVGRLTVSDGSTISTHAMDGSTGQGGDITITATEHVYLSGGSDDGYAHISSSTFGNGHGGTISISTPSLMIDDHAIIIAVAYMGFDFFGNVVGGGNAGDIFLDVGNLTIKNAGIGSQTGTMTTGQAGHITISATGNVILSDDALISTESNGLGNAGNITINSGDSFRIINSSLSTKAEQADGGNIHINGGELFYLFDSEVTASVGGGPQTVGGNIDTESEYIALNCSSIIANAYEGKGGNIQVVADTFLSDPSSEVSASSELGIEGTVEINAPDVNITGIQAPLPKAVFSAADLLQDPCIARLKAGKASSFIISGRDGLPFMPGKLLPSPVFMGEETEK